MFKTLLALLLCLLLALPCAVAETAYMPGETTTAIFSDVWNSGKMINSDLSLAMEMDAVALGMSSEEQEMLDAVLALFNSATLRMGVCRLQDGVRLELTGTYDAGNGAVAADAAIDLTYDGVRIDSSLIEGKCVTASWEKLLSMAGLSDSDIAMVMSLRDLDLNAALDLLLSSVQSYVDLAASLAQPYVQTVEDWLLALPMDMYEDLEADEDYPASALAVDIYVTEQDFANLVNKLTEQLEADTTLCALLDGVLSSADTPMTTAELCQSLRDAVAGFTDTEYPAILTFALDDNDNLLYLEYFNTEPDNSCEYAGAFLYPGEEANTAVYELLLFTMGADEQVDNAFSLSGTVAVDPADALSANLTAELVVIANSEVVLSLDYAVDTASMQTDGLPGMESTVQYNMSMTADEQSIQMIANQLVKSSLTALGGEQTDVTMNMDMYMGQQNMSVTATGSMIVEPAESGLTGSYSILESAPDIGLKRYGLQILFSSEDYVPQVLTEVSLDTATQEDLMALVAEASASGEALAVAFYDAVPEETRAILSGTSN